MRKREEQVVTAAEILDADLLALEVADGADRLVREQLEAAGMQSGERRDRLAGSQLRDDPRRGIVFEIDLSSCHRVERHVRGAADLGETFRAQQCIGEQYGCGADARIPGQPDRGHFRRPLVGERRPSTNDPCGAGC